MKRKLFSLFLIFLLLSAAFVYKDLLLNKLNDVVYYSPCDKVVEYKIGNIDSRFGITQDAFIKDINKAASMWNAAYGKTLFKNSQEGSLTINLVYDDKHTYINKIGDLNSNLATAYDSLESEIDAYQSKEAEIEAKVNNLNKEIESWNNKGGAPKEIYEKLLQTRSTLIKEVDEIILWGKEVTDKISKANSTVTELNKNIETFNILLANKPEEGIYSRNTNSIDIYFYSDENELTRTLAHELGHALGIGHIEDAEALMYMYGNNADGLNRNDLRELINVCSERTVFQPYLEEIKYIYSWVKSSYSL